MRFLFKHFKIILAGLCMFLNPKFFFKCYLIKRHLTLLILGVLCFALSGFAEAKKNNPYPLLLLPKGKVQVKTHGNNNYKGLVFEQSLRESAEIQTGENSEVYLALNETMEILIFPNSLVLLPSIKWESFEVSQILLKKGSLLWRDNSPHKKHSIFIESEMFRLEPGANSFSLAYEPDRAWFEMRVTSGQQIFSALNLEESHLLVSGQKASFQGSFENSEIAFDHLLKGKKIPKGQLSPVVAMSDNEKKSYVRDSLEVLRARDIERRKKEEEEANRIKPGQVCRKPNAKYNECAWICENNPKGELQKCRVERKKVQCVRRRCNANGEWVEDSVLDPDSAKLRCQAKPQIGSCDY